MSEDKACRVVDDVLLFRGTYKWRELLTEVRTGNAEWPDGGSIHQGFMDYYKNIRTEVHDTIDGRPIRIIAGHSVGGVMAVLYASEIARLHKAPRAVYSLGSPRIGDRRFMQLERDWQVYRIANSEDLITRIPPLRHHVGTHVPVRFETGSLLADHGLEGYSMALKKMQRRKWLKAPFSKIFE
jgi:predicted lipase